MSSPAKVQSARANGALSHGPVTPEGKQRSSRNATRHGLLSSTVVLSGESQERFDELLAEFTEEHQPRNATEAALVETMAVARWRYLRILGIQKAQLEIEMERQTAASAIVRATAAFRHLGDNSRALDLLLRYEVAYDRQFTRALNTLLTLRASQPTKPASDSAAAQMDATGPETVEPAKFLNQPNSEPAVPVPPPQAPEILHTQPSNCIPLISCCSSSLRPINGPGAHVLSDPQHQTVPRTSGSSQALDQAA